MTVTRTSLDNDNNNDDDGDDDDGDDDDGGDDDDDSDIAVDANRLKLSLMSVGFCLVKLFLSFDSSSLNLVTIIIRMMMMMMMIVTIPFLLRHLQRVIVIVPFP